MFNDKCVYCGKTGNVDVRNVDLLVIFLGDETTLEHTPGYYRRCRAGNWAFR